MLRNETTVQPVLPISYPISTDIATLITSLATSHPECASRLQSVAQSASNGGQITADDLNFIGALQKGDYSVCNSGGMSIPTYVWVLIAVIVAWIVWKMA